MGRIVVTEFVSLDGVMEAPGGDEGYKHKAWTFEFDRGDEGNKFKLDELFDAEAQLFGRRTYEGFAAAWPSREDEVGFADRINSLPKYVFSSTLERADWEPTTIISGDFAAEIGKVKDEVGGNILVAGSCQLVHGLVEHNLVDELRLMVFPVLLGTGKRLFAEHDGDKQTLKLTESKRVGGDGVLILTYEPA
ncbi:MAG TPA: dihydrofolate reductase family protein [Solirubrobacterales bacterium]|nr:dihydrofolate reductase family protein [Solirubrobacterales bacterium]